MSKKEMKAIKVQAHGHLMVNASDYLLDNFIAPHLSKLSRCGAEPIKADLPKRGHWITNYILNSTYSARWKGGYHQYVSIYLRRVHFAFEEYELGRKSLLNYIDYMRSDLEAYLEAVHHFEASLSLLYQAYEALRKMLQDMFEGGDGSKLDRLNKIYNEIKHVAGEIKGERLPKEYVAPVWIENDRVACSKAYLTFSEIADLLEEFGQNAELLSDPKNFQEKAGKSTSS